MLSGTEQGNIQGMENQRVGALTNNSHTLSSMQVKRLLISRHYT